MEVPPCVVTLDGMAFETILFKCNGLLITKRFIYIFTDVDIVIFVLIVNIKQSNQNVNVSNGHSITMYNCNCIYVVINAPLVVYIL